MPEPERLAPIDVLKTVGIVLVVTIHAVDEPGNAAEVYFLHLSRFAVPVFLAVSGWLQAEQGPVVAARTLARLRRVLLPYLVASTFAQLYLAWRGAPRSLAGVARDLLLGASFGPYYYVFSIATMILLAPLFARVRARRLLAAWIALVGLRGVLIAIATVHPGGFTSDLFWVTRDPSHSATYFLAGWLAALFREPLGVFCRKHRPLLLSLGVAAGGALSAVAPVREVPLAANLAGWLNTLVVGAVVALASSSVTRTSSVVRFVSDASYTFYLYHLFFVREVQRALPPSTVSEVTAWSAGMLGPCLIVLGSRRVLGPRARKWVGA